MEYQILTPEDEEILLRNRLRKYEADHYEHAMNRLALIATGDSDPQTIAGIQEATEIMAKLDAGHAAIASQLEAMAPAPLVEVKEL